MLRWGNEGPVVVLRQPIFYGTLCSTPSIFCISNRGSVSICRCQGWQVAAAKFLCGGQPYLVQLCGQLVVETWNNRFLDGSVEVVPCITSEDWENAWPLLFERGGYYFEGVWAGSTAEEHRLLQWIAAHPLETRWGEPELAAGIGLSSEEMTEVLQRIVRHDTLVQETDEGWHFIVPLMHQWVGKYQATA